jgi:hypothetical protein
MFFKIIGQIIGKMSILLAAIFSMFDFQDLLEKDLNTFIKDELGELAKLFKERFGKFKIRVTYENAVLFVRSLILTLMKFHSLKNYYDFIVQAETQNWNQQIEASEYEEALNAVSLE